MREKEVIFSLNVLKCKKLRKMIRNSYKNANENLINTAMATGDQILT